MGLKQTKHSHRHDHAQFTQTKAMSPTREKTGRVDYDLLFSSKLKDPDCFTTAQPQYPSKGVICWIAEGMVFINGISSLRGHRIKTPGIARCHHCRPAAQWGSLLDVFCTCSLVPQGRRRLSLTRQQAAYLLQMPPASSESDPRCLL